jgi:hypothetical protein
MTARKTITPRFAICIDNREYPVSLELHKVYRVLPDRDAEQDGDMRIVDESGEDYIYPARFFMLLDLPQPSRLALTKTYVGWSQQG